MCILLTALFLNLISSTKSTLLLALYIHSCKIVYIYLTAILSNLISISKCTFLLTLYIHSCYMFYGTMCIFTWQLYYQIWFQVLLFLLTLYIHSCNMLTNSCSNWKLFQEDRYMLRLWEIQLDNRSKLICIILFHPKCSYKLLVELM